jgi:hypothetical protein
MAQAVVGLVDGGVTRSGVALFPANLPGQRLAGLRVEDGSVDRGGLQVPDAGRGRRRRRAARVNSPDVQEGFPGGAGNGREPG